MILEITEHDHPALRTKGRRVEKVDAKIRQLAEEMIETMRAAEGIGLAAQQVGLPLQLFVLEVPHMKDRPSAMRLDGMAVDFEPLMPMVLINPRIETFGRTRIGNEGCLSFPGLRGDVPRPFPSGSKHRLSPATRSSSKPMACSPARCSTSSTTCKGSSSSTA